jgi:hypothetical protein
VKKGFILTLLASIISLLLIAGCENNYPDSLWDANYNSKPTPVISSIEPADFTFSGISTITINGQNFSSIAAENQVFFDGKAGTVISSSATQLEVKVPVLVADSINIAVRVDGAFLYGYFSPYALKDAAVIYSKVDEYVDGAGLAVDKDDRIYFFDTGSRNFTSIAAPESALVTFAPGGTPVNTTGMRFGPDGAIWHLRKNKNIYRIYEGGNREIFTKVDENVTDLDFDQNLTLWVGGTGEAIFSVNITTGSTHLAEEYTDYIISAVRVYNNELYVAAYWAGDGSPTSFAEGIWKHTITSDTTLGARQEVFDWASYVGEGGATILSMTFDEDGILYVGADKDVAITMVDPVSKTTEPLYPEILVPPATYIMWGPGNFLYVNRHSDDVTVRNFVRIETVKNGAPYFGMP